MVIYPLNPQKMGEWSALGEPTEEVFHQSISTSFFRSARLTKINISAARGRKQRVTQARITDQLNAPKLPNLELLVNFYIFVLANVKLFCDSITITIGL